MDSFAGIYMGCSIYIELVKNNGLGYASNLLVSWEILSRYIVSWAQFLQR